MSQSRIKLTIEELRSAVRVYSMLNGIGINLDRSEVDKETVDFGYEGDGEFTFGCSLLDSKTKQSVGRK